MSIPSGSGWIAGPLIPLIKYDAAILRIFGLVVTLAGAAVLSAGANSTFVARFGLKSNFAVIFAFAASGAIYIYTLTRANTFSYYIANTSGINVAVGAALLVATARSTPRRLCFSVLAGFGIALSLVGGRLVGGAEGGVVACALIALTTSEPCWRDRCRWVGVVIGSAAIASLGWVAAFGNFELYLTTVKTIASVAGKYVTLSFHVQKEIGGYADFIWHGAHSRSCIASIFLIVPIVVFWRTVRPWAVSAFAIIIALSAVTQSIASHAAAAVNQQGFLVSCVLAFVFAVRMRGAGTGGFSVMDRWLPVATLAILPLIAGLGSMAPAAWGASDNFTPWLILAGTAMSAFLSLPRRGVWVGLIAASLVVIDCQPLEVFVMKRQAYLADALGKGGDYPRMEGIPLMDGFRVPVDAKTYADGIRRLITGATADGGRYRVMNLNELGIETLLSGLPVFGQVLTQFKWGVEPAAYNDDLTCRFLAGNPLAPGEQVILVANTEEIGRAHV